MVNARTPCTIRAHFCEIFAVSGRFLHFKNPLNYTDSLEINQEARHTGNFYSAASTTYAPKMPLTILQNTSAILSQHRNGAQSALQQGNGCARCPAAP
jgi:hypothetical protein